MAAATSITAVGVSSSAIEMRAFRGDCGIVDQLASEWRDLASDAVDDQPFYRPEWIRAHIQVFLPRAQVVLITARHRDRLCLVLPLVEERGTFSKVPLRKLRAPVNVHGGRFDVLRRCGPEGDAAIQATWEYLRQLDGWDLLQLGRVPSDSAIDRLIGAARASRFRTLQLRHPPSPFVPVPEDPAQMRMVPPNSKLRSQMRHAQERLRQLGTVKFYRVDTAERDQLERFYRLEASGWKGKEGSAILCNGSRPFYDQIAEDAAHFGYFSLYLLECDQRLIAGHFAFTHRGRCYSPIVAHDETFRRFGPGHLIVGEIVRDCMQRGIRCYDFTGQDQPWKMKWTTQTRAMRDYFVFKGPLGRLAHAIGVGLRSAVGG